MKTAVVLAVWAIIPVSFAFSQSESFDSGSPDTLVLVISTPPIEGDDVPLVVEVWVYNDEPILSFSVGFQWNNTKMHLDSAILSPLLDSAISTHFNFFKDSFDSSNIYQKFQLGGFAVSEGVSAFPQGRRKWATYYFNLDNWSANDTVMVSLLPESEIEFAFVTNGPFYPLDFQPRFGGPLLFPGISTSIENEPQIPREFTLYQNYPNPFNPQTTIEFQIDKKSQVELEIFNILGERVSTLINDTRSAGTHKLIWDGKTDAGREAASGVYFYRLRYLDLFITRKMNLVK